MSRSVLTNLLRQAFNITHVATHRNTSTPEAKGLLAEQLSRRRVLQTGIAWAGMTGLRPSLSGLAARATDTTAKVLIVGAGIAGLTTAYRLRQAGVAVDVVEASQRVGGRLRSFTLPSRLSHPVELGGEFIDSAHTYVRSLAAELGLELADLHQADAGLEPEILYFQGTRLSHDQVVEKFVPLAQQIVQDLQAVGKRPNRQSPNPTAVRLDRLSLADYLDAADVDPVINQLVRAAYITEYGLDAENQSSLNLLFLIGTELGKWSAYGISDERWHVVGGNEQIPRRLAALVSDAIEPGTALESIRTTPDGRYRVSLRQGPTSVERIYERVVLTIPFTLLRHVDLAVDLPPLKRQAIAQLGYGTSTKLAIPYSDRIWRTRYASTMSIYTDLDFQNTWESSRYAEGSGGWVTNLRAGQRGVALGGGNPETHVPDLINDLEPIFPGLNQIQRGRAVRAFWAAEPYALGSYSCYLPGQWTTLAGVEVERVGNLWFAGEHCSLKYQGFMNGACETAELAALDILQDLNLQAGAAQQATQIAKLSDRVT
jgi:monoamine oxidase